MLAGEPVLVPGDGQTQVQFCYAEELAHIVTVACEGLLVPGIYNVAETRPYTFDQYLAVLADVAGVTPRLTYVHDDTIKAREYFPFRAATLTLDPSALDAAGYPHRIGLPAGLATTYTWFLTRGHIVGEPTRK